MVTWHKGSTYPDVDSLAQAYQDKKRENVKSAFLYMAATLILGGALFFASKEILVIIGIAVAFLLIFAWLAFRQYGYNKVSSIIEAENFSWTAGKVQNKWKRQMFDLNSQDPYQVGVCDEWVPCDMTTYNQAEIGKQIVLVKNETETIGIMIPEGKAYKSVRRAARAAS